MIHSHIGRLINETGCSVLQIGGVGDHVHILFLLARDVCLSHVVEHSKRKSSKWIKTISQHYRRFAWQAGYGAFSVSQSVLDKTLHYVSHQKEHHAKRAFRDEYISFLKLYGIDYDERFVLSD